MDNTDRDINEVLTCLPIENENPAKKGFLWRWGALILSLLIMWLFVFQAAPAMQQIGCIADVHEAIRDYDIDATGLVYTEVELFGDADVHIRDAMKY